MKVANVIAGLILVGWFVAAVISSGEGPGFGTTIAFLALLILAAIGSSKSIVASKLSKYWGLCIVLLIVLFYVAFWYGFSGRPVPMFIAYALMLVTTATTIYKTVTFVRSYRTQAQNPPSIKS